MMRFLHSPTGRLGKKLSDGTKRIVNTVLNTVAPKCRERRPPSPCTVRRVLLVRPNFRLGNAVLVTSLLPVLRARFPQATIDVLTANTTARVLGGLGFARVHPLSRSYIRTPWRFIDLFLRLRRRRFDVAIDGGMGSFSGALYSWLSGARWRIGSQGRHDRFLNVRLQLPPCASVYDVPKRVARALGVTAAAWPSYAVQASEALAADTFIDRWQVETEKPRMAFIGAFVGGHAHKRWPRQHWLDLLTLLDGQGVPVLVFPGPEERDFAAVLLAQAWNSVRVVPPQPLRAFAALVARTSLLITPDSGPMHLAAALGVPVLALLATQHSRFYVPTGEKNTVLIRPRPADVIAELEKPGMGELLRDGSPHPRPAAAAECGFSLSVFDPPALPTS